MVGWRGRWLISGDKPAPVAGVIKASTDVLLTAATN